MIEKVFAFNASEVGYNHIKANKVCEDYSDYYPGEKVKICVVADGHGSDDYPRTDRGSRFACNAAINCICTFVEDADVSDVLADENNDYQLMIQLAKSILLKWHELIDEDYSKSPFADEELKNVSEKYKQRYLGSNEDHNNIYKAYGCTLICFAVTESYSFGMQIGDGKCVVVDRRGNFTEPIPWDDNCQLNITTSICDGDAVDEFRYYITNEMPAAVICGSDGIDDSYSNVDEMYALYRSILKIYIEHGEEVLQKEIKEYLPTLTKKGSGDDVSIGLLVDGEYIKKLLAVFDIQMQLFNLTSKLNGVSQKIISNSEKDSALSNRHHRWLDSGKPVGGNEKDDFDKINVLREEKQELEREKSELDEQIHVQELMLENAFQELSSSIPNCDNASPESDSIEMIDVRSENNDSTSIMDGEKTITDDSVSPDSDDCLENGDSNISPEVTDN